ncbi:D-Ala-D-Ala carboxypeptidase family metallohydrolase [Pseudomonas defluvii]|uniref:D-Ala-D-Ala carboxypeptidase family metallohydrolase n=1 Tax=Pseudomonas defluvii TaxID=1876757 RepID=UPI0039061076
MNLSKHFTLSEMTASRTASRLGIDNTPNDEVLLNLKRLCATLEQVRSLVGRPVLVSSGYRSPALNRAVGGSPKSTHRLGLAADISVAGMAPLDLAQLIAQSTLAFDQLILEFDSWVHLGLSASAERRQILTIRKGTGYLPGLQ